MTAPNVTVIDDVTENVTCLGCGCACDDIAVVVRDGRIAEARNACPLGVRWFGDGQLPSRCVSDGSDVPLAAAIDRCELMLSQARRPLVYLAPGLSSESQRQGVAIADTLRARLDTVTSSTASAFVLANQERGFASATFGEIRNRADVVVFWGIDLAQRYPRFTSRYAPDAVGLYVDGRHARTVVAVDVDGAMSTVDADRRLTVGAADELATLTALEAFARAGSDASTLATLPGAAWAVARTLAPSLLAARYVAIVYDAEPDGRADRSPRRFERLTTLSQALNDHTRCAAIALRAGGNRSGVDGILVAQTGYPFAVDFGRGYPRYAPHDGTTVDLVRDGGVDLALVAGDSTSLPGDVLRALGNVPYVLIGPGASESPLGSAVVAIDTGADGIHADGTATRADDVPLPLRASISGPPDVSSVLRSIAAATNARQNATRRGDVASATAAG